MHISNLVSKDRNIALHKDTSQSTTLVHRGWNFESSLANDGNIDQMAGVGGCAHTNADTPYAWWTVDFGDVYRISRVNIYARTDCCR